MRKLYSWLAPLLLVATGSAARADTILFTQFNASNPNVTSPYAELTITNIASNELQFVLTDYGSNVATFRNLGFDLNGISSNDITGVTASSDGTTWSTSTVKANATMDGFGSFDVMLEPGTPSPSKQAPEYFDVTFATTVTPSSVEKLNSGGANGPGFYFAAEYFPSSGSTGYIGVPSPSAAVPAPPGVALVMSGCGAFGLFYFARRRKTIALT